MSIIHAQDTSNCPATTPLGLVVGQQGRVLPGTSNRVRSTPSTSGEVLYQIEGGAVFDVAGQAECGDGYRWWQVTYNGQTGWTVEGNADGYFLEPLSIEAAATAAPTAAPETAECALQPRLTVGGEGRITSGTPSRVRAIAGTSGEQVGQIQPIEVFTVLEGPVCADGVNWWRISVGSLEGWTAEGLDEYFTEPVEATPTPPPAYIGLPDPSGISWNSDGTLIAVGTRHDGIFIYDTTDWSHPPTQVFAGVDVKSLAFVPNEPQQIAVNLHNNQAGDCFEDKTQQKSGVYVYDLSTDTIPVMIFDFTDHCSTPVVKDLQFNTDGTILITNQSGQFQSYTLPDGTPDRTIDPVLSDYPQFIQIAISGDGTQLALAQTTSGDSGYLFHADYSTGELVGFEDGRITDVITALALSSDGNRIVIGDEVGSLRTYTRASSTESYADYHSFIRGERSSTSNRINIVAIAPNGDIVTAESDPYAVVRVFDPETLTPITSYFAGASSSAAIDLAFNPDGSQLAVLVDDTVRILDTSDYSEIAELVRQRN
ncbi:MAG: SH3 domain-containing protein [Anaerolineae bacterium]|nr:SH3 domain-containing protein [Anaerolineae bacterium]